MCVSAKTACRRAEKEEGMKLAGQLNLLIRVSRATLHTSSSGGGGGGGGRRGPGGGGRRGGGRRGGGWCGGTCET